MSFGISRALAGLYQGPNKRESAKEELAILESFDQRLQLEKQQQEAAQLKEAAYYEQISKFADTLLEPDRNRINEKAKDMAKMISENLRSFGGDLNKFFENGGHRLLNKYKNGILNSDEASIYRENKKNLEIILDIESKGMGHLINENDRRALDNWYKNKEGRITYTGLLSEIVMPSSENYLWDQDIPAEDILLHDSNKTKILGNYKLTYPDRPFPPSKADLIQFIESNYKGKGSNYKLLLQQQALALKSASLAASTKTNRSGAGKSTSDDDGYLGYDSKQGVFNEQFRNSITGGIIKLFQDMPNVNAAEFVNGNYWDSFSNQDFLRTRTNGDWNKTFVGKNLIDKNFLGMDYSDDEGFRIFGFNLRMPDFYRKVYQWAVRDNFAPLNSKRIMSEIEPEFIMTALNIDKEANKDGELFDVRNRVLKNYKLNDQGVYNAMGFELVNTGIDLEKYHGDYNVEGIITVGVAKSANIDQEGNSAGTRRNIMMGIYNGENFNAENTKEFNQGLLGSDPSQSANVENKIAIVLSNDRGDVFYQTIDPSDAMFSKLSRSIEDINDLSAINQESEIRRREREYAEALKEIGEERYLSFYDIIDGNQDIVGAISAEMADFSSSLRNDGVRENLIKSFYTAAVNSDQMQGVDPVTAYSYMTNNALFTKEMNEYSSKHFGGQEGDYKSIIRDYNYSDEQIINLMMSNFERFGESEALSFLQQWKIALNALNRR